MKRFATACALGLVACFGTNGPSPSPQPQGDGSAPPSEWRAGVGEGGLVVQTFDDRAWSARSVAPVDLFGVTCVGNVRGWAVGAGGTIVHTEDGGKTWSNETSGTSASLRAVRFADATHGVVAGDGGALAHTTDGGATWASVAAGNTSFTSVASTSTSFFVVGSGGALLRSTDLGVTFAPAAIDGAGDLTAIAASASGTLVLASDTSGRLFASTDGGTTFHLETTASAPIASIAIGGAEGYASASNDAYAVGEGGTIVQRTGAGNWITAASGTSANLRAALVTSTFTYAAGDDGTLVALANGVWTPIETGTHAAIYALDDL